MAVNAPEDRRFRRVRSAAAGPRRRRVARAALVARASAAVAVLVVVVAAAAWAVQASSRMRVLRVIVSGNQQVATGDLLARLEGLEGAPILAVDLRHWQQQLEASAWVREASLRRVLPDTVEVSVVERQPVAIGRLGSELVLVDASGDVIDDFGPNYDSFDLPIVDGLVRRSTATGGMSSGPQASLLAELLDELSGDPPLLGKVSQVDVAEPGNVVIWLDDDPARLILGDREFRKRVTGYLEVRGALRARVPEMDAVDLRFDRRVFVRPAEETGTSRARPAGRSVRARS